MGANPNCPSQQDIALHTQYYILSSYPVLIKFCEDDDHNDDDVDDNDDGDGNYFI